MRTQTQLLSCRKKLDAILDMLEELSERISEIEGRISDLESNVPEELPGVLNAESQNAYIVEFAQYSCDLAMFRLSTQEFESIIKDLKKTLYKRLFISKFYQ